MEDLIERVKYYIEKHDLKKKCRKPRFIHRRIYFFYILRESGATYEEIGELFDLNHSTVMHGIQRYKNLRHVNDHLLNLDIAEYTGKIKLMKRKYNLRNDILKATTIRDLDIIKSRASNNLYKELI
jgi:hypothetical protein